MCRNCLMQSVSTRLVCLLSFASLFFKRKQSEFFSSSEPFLGYAAKEKRCESLRILQATQSTLSNILQPSPLNEVIISGRNTPCENTLGHCLTITGVGWVGGSVVYQYHISYLSPTHPRCGCKMFQQV